MLYGEIRLHIIEVEKIAKMIERPPAMNWEPLFLFVCDKPPFRQYGGIVADYVLIFFVKMCFVAVGPEKDVRHPVWRAPHLFADGFQIDAGVAFDNQFIVDMPDNEAVT